MSCPGPQCPEPPGLLLSSGQSLRTVSLGRLGFLVALK